LAEALVPGLGDKLSWPADALASRGKHKALREREFKRDRPSR